MYTLLVTNKYNCSATFAAAVGEQKLIPVITLDSVNNSNCSSLGPNGSAIARIFNGGTERTDYVNFTFNWDAGQTMTGTNPVPNSTSRTLATQPAGYYTLEVTETSTTCKSLPVTIEILDVLDYPDAVIAPTNSTNCPTPFNIAANGKLEVTSIDGAAIPVGKYTFAWFNGTDETTPATAPNNLATLSGIQGPATRSVRITNTQNGCSSLTPAQIADASVIPVVSLAAIDNDICNQALTSPLVDFKGEVRPTVTGNGLAITDFTDYSFAWTNKEFGTNNVKGNWIKLDSGMYSLQVTNTVTGCQSTVVNAQVKNIVNIPQIVATPDASDNCTPLTSGNGKVFVSTVNTIPIDATSNFGFKWFKGQTIAGTQVASAFTTTETLRGGPAEYYTVQVTDPTNGCQNTETILLPDESQLPLLTLRQDPNTKCAAFNGEAEVLTITHKGNNITNAAGLTYAWYNGNGALPANIRTETGTSVTGLQNGVFVSATVTITALGCTSDFASIEIQNGIVLPALTPSVTASKNCTNTTPAGLPDGSASVTVAPADSYNFGWYSGSVVGGAGTEVSTTNSISNIQGSATAFYTVQATSTTTLCSTSLTVLVPDDSQIPLVDPLTPTNNENCPAFPNGSVNAPDGKVEFNGLTYRGAVIAAPYTDFTFIWSGPGAPATGANITELANKGAGNYTLQIQHNISKCISDPVTATIVDDLDYPVIDHSIVDQTSCDTNNPNGGVAASVGGGTAGFGFEWYDGIGAGAAGSGTASSSLSGLASGDYTVRVHNTTTACTTTKAVFVPDRIVYPNLAWSNVKGVERCDNPDGEADANISGLTTDLASNPNFTIYYVTTPFTADPPTDPSVITGSADNFSSTSAPVVGVNPPSKMNLSSGYITAVVRDNLTTCISSPETVEIADLTEIATITIGPKTDAGFCTAGTQTGGISISLAGGHPGYNISWYPKTPNNAGPISFPASPPTFDDPLITNAQNLTAVASGVYTVVVVDDYGCGTYAIESVPFIGAPTVTVDSDPITSCLSPSNGEIRVTVAGPGTYSVSIHSGNGPTLPALAGGEICDNGTDDDGDGLTDGADSDCFVTGRTLSNLGVGPYYIEVIDYSGNNKFCPIAKNQILSKKAFDPIVDLTMFKPNTSCTPTSAADGEIQISARPTAGDITTPSDYEATVDGASYTIPADGTPFVVGGLEPIGYTVTVADLVTGCSTDAFIQIPDQPLVPKSMTVSTNPDTWCYPNSNGFVRVDGVSEGNKDTDYDYVWANDLALSTVLFGPDPATQYQSGMTGWKSLAVTNQGNGDQTYYVQGIKTAGDGVGCKTPIVMAVVNDLHVTPLLNLSSTGDTSCEALGEGTVTILASTTTAEAAVAAATYTYTFNGNNEGVQNGAVNYTKANISAGNYPVTAINNVSNCLTTGSITVDVERLPLTILDTDVTDQYLCKNDGQVDVVAISFNNAPSATNLYTYTWYKAPANAPGTFDPSSPVEDFFGDAITTVSLSTGQLPGEFPDMEAGTYYVIAKRLPGSIPGAGCETPPFRSDVLNKQERPTVVLTPDSDTSCDGSGEGSIQVNVTDDLDPANINHLTPYEYAYTWTGAQTVPVPAPNESNGNGDGTDGDGDNPQSLVTGAYTLLVRNITTECEMTAATTISLNEVPVFIADVDSDTQTFCPPIVNGSIEVIDVTTQKTNEAPISQPLNDFSYTWSQEGIAGTIVTTSVVRPNLAAGTYYVFATRTQSTNNGPGIGCSSAPRRVDIIDETFLPTVLLTPTNNTACSSDPNIFEGSIRIDADEHPSSVGTANYTYTWSSADNTNTSGVLTAPATTVGDGINDVQGALRDDTYTIRVTNDVTQCYVDATTIVPKTNIPIIILSTSTTPKTLCRPDGSAFVQDIVVGNASDNVYTNFDFVWYEGSVDNANIVLSGQAESLLSETQYAGPAGQFTMNTLNYYVKAVRSLTALNGDGTPAIGRGCESVPVLVTIDDIAKDPVLQLQPTLNTFCMGGNARITALATDPAYNVGPYETTWLFNNVAMPGNPVAGNNVVKNNLLDGTYNVTLRNTFTNCSVVQEVTVIKDITQSLPNIITVVPDPPDDCRPTGSAEVTAINIGGVPAQRDDYARFVYRWVKSDLTTPVGNSTVLLSNVKEGTYYVSLDDLLTGCGSSIPVEVTIEPCQNCFVNVDIVQTLKQINCKIPTNDYSGELQASTTNYNGETDATLPGNFVYTWYSTLDTTGVAMNNGARTLSNLADGQYSVKVLDQSTNCRGMEYYIIQDETATYKPELLLTTAPRQSCVAPDGGILAQQVAVIPYNTPSYPYLPNYTTTLDGAAMTETTAGAMTWFQSGLDTVALYTVQIVDNNTGCSVQDAIMVPGDIRRPIIDIDEENPLQTCRDSRLVYVNGVPQLIYISNGQLSATADGGQVPGFTFEWFGGQWSVDTPPTDPALVVNNKLIGAGREDNADLMFTVRVTNDVTQCVRYADVQLTQQLDYPYDVQASLVRPITRCDYNDGWVRAAVDGETAGYNFYWTDTNVSGMNPAQLQTFIETWTPYAGFDRQTSPLLPMHVEPDTANVMMDLPPATGPQTVYVVAENIETGCPAQTSIVIPLEREFPQLVFRTTASFCEDVPTVFSKGKGSGSIELVLEPTSIVSDDIQWTKLEPHTSYPDGSLSGNYIAELLPGEYSVLVTTNKACQVEGSTIVPTDILSYNLVTQNQDGKNDRFVIDCISHFPNNNVKIFNRSGVLVYEADFYDNQERFFDGIGKNGIYMTGNVLPVGTYFYIIDKGDGSKPKTGYLELVR
jgi:gliding motility-associated-like protein